MTGSRKFNNLHHYGEGFVLRRRKYVQMRKCAGVQMFFFKVYLTRWREARASLLTTLSLMQ